MQNESLKQYHEMSEGIYSLKASAASLKRMSGAAPVHEFGYISDEDFRGFTTDAISANFYYFGLQYQLLPTMLLWSTDPQTVVCHLHQRSNLKQILARHRLVVHSEIENGYFVLKHEAP